MRRRAVLYLLNRFFSPRSSGTLPLNVLKTHSRIQRMNCSSAVRRKVRWFSFRWHNASRRQAFLLPIECLAIFVASSAFSLLSLIARESCDCLARMSIRFFYTYPLENDCETRTRNASYRRERYTFEIDIHPESIVSNRATNIREASMWRRSTPLLGTLDRRDRPGSLNDEFVRDRKDF